MIVAVTSSLLKLMNREVKQIVAKRHSCLFIRSYKYLYLSLPLSTSLQPPFKLMVFVIPCL